MRIKSIDPIKTGNLIGIRKLFLIVSIWVCLMFQTIEALENQTPEDKKQNTSTPTNTLLPKNSKIEGVRTDSSTDISGNNGIKGDTAPLNPDKDENIYEQVPKWEFDVIWTEILVPHYPGSNEYYGKSFLLPFFIYRLDKLDLGRRPTFIYDLTENLEISLSLSINLPSYPADKDAGKPENIDDPDKIVVRDKNYRRRGMRPTSLLLGTGVKLSYYKTYFDLYTDFLYYNSLTEGVGGIGSTVTPGIRFFPIGKKQDLRITLGYSLTFGDKNYNRYYYQVDKRDELEDRPAYKAKEGLVSENVYGFLRYKLTDKLTFGLGLFNNYLYYAANVDSPLVVTKKNTSRVIFISYKIFTSDLNVWRKK